MVFYKPITDIPKLQDMFVKIEFNKKHIYGGYIGIDESNNEVGKCLMCVDGYNCYILSVECDKQDNLLVEGFLRSALNFCANRSAYMAHCELKDISDVLNLLGFENKDNVYSGDIPTLLKGSCCK